MFTALVREVGTVVGWTLRTSCCAPSTWRGSWGYDLTMAAYELQEQGMDTVDANLEMPIEVAPDGENLRCLRAKREKLGHRLHHQDVKFEPDAEA